LRGRGDREGDLGAGLCDRAAISFVSSLIVGSM